MSEVIHRHNERHPENPAYKAAHDSQKKKAELLDKQVAELAEKVKTEKKEK